jgi:hypothetical protein
MIKLPVLAIVREAYAFLWRQRRVFWALAVPGVIVVAIVGAVVVWLEFKQLGYIPVGTVPPGTVAGGWKFFSVFLMTLGHSLFYFLVVILYSVAWHRAYLLPGEAVTVGSAYHWRMRQTRFLVNYLKIFVTLVPVFLLFVALLIAIGPIVKATGTVFLALPIQLAYVAVGGYIFARCSLLFPATAIDRHMDFWQGVKLSEGNGWRLLAIIVLVAIPVTVVTLPLNVLIQVFVPKTGLLGTLTGNLVLSLVTDFIAFIGVAVGVTALSISYKYLTAAVGPTPPIPEEPAA